ncbi:hypothetical protein B2J93_9198 [Marssonina coronariae]|uniref:quinol--cytochrome-c reductase n=1 Tax=Diplocarpon coronariae TaxID=2795749 RepID=A0A218ZGL8_9HELO|nr:hypothetical protein B2J93_9198 [Marssonina coronariae]
MASLTRTSRTLLRTLPRSSSLAVRAASTSSFDSPFKGQASDAGSKIPDFSNYRSKAGSNSNLLFQYFMVGTMGALTAAGAKATVQDFLVNMSASADVLAMAKVEVDLAAIPEGKNVIIKWRGKPVFIRHRTADEIKEAENVKVESLRDPQKDEDRVKRPEWLVMVSAHIWDVYPSERPETTEDGSALATVPTMIYQDAFAEDLPLLTSRFQNTTSLKRTRS